MDPAESFFGWKIRCNHQNCQRVKLTKNLPKGCDRTAVFAVYCKRRQTINNDQVLSGDTGKSMGDAGHCFLNRIPEDLSEVDVIDGSVGVAPHHFGSRSLASARWA